MAQDEEQKRIAAESQREAESKELIVRVNRLFKQSDIGARFMSRTFDRFEINNDNRAAYSVAKNYADDFRTFKSNGSGLLLTGLYGTGKTHLAASIAIQLLNEEFAVVFGTFSDLMNKIKDTYDNYSYKSMDESQILRLYESVDLLIIDDLGKERLNDWVFEKMYHIINKRYEKNLPVLVTSNYDIKTILGRLPNDRFTDISKSIVSRLHEMCCCVTIGGNDYRVKRSL
jgi:DNA replication protein DnaC